MSKVVYVLDKIVWMLLITALTTQALQMAGLIENTNKGLRQIEYRQDHDYSFGVQVGAEDDSSDQRTSDIRGKRQVLEHRSPFIDSLFNIPISTLTAVNNLVQSTRPAFQSLRNFAWKRIEKSLNSRFDSKKKDQKETTETKESNSKNLIQRLYPVFIRPKEDDSDSDNNISGDKEKV